MAVIHSDLNLSSIASAIGDPARARMLCSLLDGCARTATELAALGEVGASTASGHFSRLREQGLVELAVQGKHRYYRLASADVAAALEALLVVAGVPRMPFKPSTPPDLCHARTCYGHMAGHVAVQIHDTFLTRRFLKQDHDQYALTDPGAHFLLELGLDVETIGSKRRCFAKPCMDWSARRPHIGSALGEALLALFVLRGWVEKQLDSRVVRLTPSGERQFARLFGVA